MKMELLLEDDLDNSPSLPVVVEAGAAFGFDVHFGLFEKKG